MAIKSYAALEAKGKLVPHNFEQRTMREDDVIIDVMYCGVCHSDIHQVNNDWGGAIFPIVPGHEVVGKVAKVGSSVTKFKEGDLVAVGCMVDSCQHCNPCKNDLEQYCDEMPTFTYTSHDRIDGTVTYGGYAEQLISREKFVLSVPTNLDTKSVAPILCAGVTMWSPLMNWKVKAGDNVAIVGLGGLGHMGIKLAKALGANVTLFSRSKGKETDAKELGASEVVISTDSTQMESVKGKFDLIIDTVPYNHDLNPYIDTLSVDGTLVLVGHLGNMDGMLNSAPMVMKRKAVAGSMIGGIKETQELLDFCGKHNIVADCEIIDIQDINNAYERMLKSDVKYRFVIDLKSIQK